LFSITKLWPSFCCSRSAISRATMSGVDPGPNGTTILTVFAGQSCAAAGASASSDAATAIVRFVFIRLSCILRLVARHSSWTIGSLQAGVCRMPSCTGEAMLRRQGDRLASGAAMASTAPA